MEDPLRIIAAESGVFLRREALEAGYTDRLLASLCKQGVLYRVRHGCYCFNDVWQTATPEERHLIRARAVMRVTPGPIAFSHVTALVAHGVSVWGVDLDRVHVTRLAKGAGRREAGVTHHVGICREPDTTVASGLPVTAADRAVVESASILRVESGLVAADSALHLGLTDPDAVQRRGRHMAHWGESRQIACVISLMDGRAESAGESRGRWLFRSQGLPMPDLQFEVYEDGVLVAILDFVWHEHRAFGEFDGKLKYLKPFREGETPGDVVFREKQREDRVRQITQYSCGRMVWDDLSRPRRTAAYFRTVLGLD